MLGRLRKLWRSNEMGPVQIAMAIQWRLNKNSYLSEPKAMRSDRKIDEVFPRLGVACLKKKY